MSKIQSLFSKPSLKLNPHAKEYVWVPPVQEEQKEETKVYVPRSMSMLRSNAGFSKALSKPIKVKLFSNSITNTSAVNTALTFTQTSTFNSGTYPEIASFNAIYDEARVLAVKIHYNFYASVPSSSYGGALCGVAINFDPTTPSATTVAGILEQAHNTGLHWLSADAAIQPSVMLNSGKLPTLHAKVPGPLAPITSSDVPGSAWFAVDGGTPPVIFLYQGYCAPLGALGVSALVVVTELDVEFRLRV